MSAYFEVSVWLRDTEDRNCSIEIRNFNTLSLPISELSVLLEKHTQELTTAKQCKADFFSQGKSPKESRNETHITCTRY